VLADADWLDGIDEGRFSRFLSLVCNESLVFTYDNVWVVDFEYLSQTRSFYESNVSAPRFVDSPLLEGLLLVPSDQGIEGFEARWVAYAAVL
jgi:hypothetical protein